MALTEVDIEQFIAELQANPQLRDRVRDAILAHDFLALRKRLASEIPTRPP